MRTITAGDPVPGITLIAVRIRATGQLQGTIDEFNVTARTIARDWDASTSSWMWRPTSQPAALFRHILQHPSRRKPATDAQIDLDRLVYWDGLTRPAGREFNGVFDAKTSLYDALTRIARLGRAMVSLRDLKFSVVIDEPRSVPVRMFTPRNSWTYEGEMTHEPVPHGYRIGFVNEQAEWKTERGGGLRRRLFRRQRHANRPGRDRRPDQSRPGVEGGSLPPGAAAAAPRDLPPAPYTPAKTAFSSAWSSLQIGRCSTGRSGIREQGQIFISRTRCSSAAYRLNNSMLAVTVPVKAGIARRSSASSSNCSAFHASTNCRTS